MNEEKKINPENNNNLGVSTPPKKSNKKNSPKKDNTPKSNNSKKTNNPSKKKTTTRKTSSPKKKVSKEIEENKLPETIKTEEVKVSKKKATSKSDNTSKNETKTLEKENTNLKIDDKSKEVIVKEDNSKKDKEPKENKISKEKETSKDKNEPKEDKSPKETKTIEKDTSKETTTHEKKNIKTRKSPKTKKDVIKETTEIITLKDKNSEKEKNYQEELKDINNNNEFAKAIFQSDDIEGSIKEEEENQEKLSKEIDELLIKEKKVNMIEPFIFIVVLILCLVGLYVILFTKDSAIISSLLNSINTEITTNLKSLNTLKEEINKGLSISASIDTTNLEYSNLKDYTYLLTLSNKDTTYNGEFTLEKEDKVFKTDYTYLDNSLYLKNDSYYYPIKWDNPYSLNPLSINYSNLNNNVEVLKNYLINNLKYSRSEKTTEEINGEKLKVLKVYFTEAEINEGLKNMLSTLKGDSELLKSIAKNLGITEERVVKVLNQDITYQGDITLNIYTKGLFQEFVGFKIEGNDNKSIEYLITQNTKSLYINGNAKINITKSDDKLLIYKDDIKVLDIKYSENKDKTWDFQISNIINNYQGSIVLKDVDSTTKEMIFSIKDTNKSDINLEVTMDIKSPKTYQEGMDLTDATYYRDITEEDQENIRNTISDILFNEEKSLEE